MASCVEFTSGIHTKCRRFPLLVSTSTPVLLLLRLVLVAGGLEGEVEEAIAAVAETRTVRSSDEAEGPRASAAKQAGKANVVPGLAVPEAVTQHQAQVKATRKKQDDGGGGIRWCCQSMNAGPRNPAQLAGWGGGNKKGLCACA